MSGDYCKDLVLLAVKQSKLKRLNAVVNDSPQRINGDNLVNTDNSSTTWPYNLDGYIENWKQEIIDNIK